MYQASRVASMEMRRRGEAQNASALRALDSRAVEGRQWLERANKARSVLNLHAPFHSIAGDTPRDRCEPGGTHLLKANLTLLRFYAFSFIWIYSDINDIT